MISVHDLITSRPVDDAITFGIPDRPIYARLQDGLLYQIDSVSGGQIMTSMGAHDVIVLGVGDSAGVET